MNGEWLGNIVARSQRFPVPPVTECNGKKGIATLHDILARGDRLARWHGGLAVAINDAHAPRWRAGAADQKDTQGNSNHQTLKTC
jgi:hypothetical protein